MRKLKRFIALTLTALMSFGIQGLSSYAAVGTIKNDVTVIADTAAPDMLSTTTAAPARTIMTTTAPHTTTTTTVSYDDTVYENYPQTGIKTISIDIVDQSTRYSIACDVDVTLTLITNDATGHRQEPIAEWNTADKKGPYILEIPYTLYALDSYLFIMAELSDIPEGYLSNYNAWNFIFDYSKNANNNYEIDVVKAPTVTLAPLDYCEGCGKHLESGEGIRTPLGMFLCTDCRKTGMGGTTTAPRGDSTTTTAHTTVWTGTTTQPTTVTGTTTVWTGTTPPTTVLTTTAAPLDHCEGCGKHLESGEGIRTPLGMFLCIDCRKTGIGGTTTAPHGSSVTTTASTTALTGTTPPTTVLTTTTEKRACEGCGKEIYRSESVVTPLGIFLCTDCRATGMGGTTVPPYTDTGTTTTRPTAATTTTTTRPAWEMMLNPPAKTTYAVGEELDFSGADASVYGFSTGWEAIYYKISSSPITSSDFVIDSSEFNSFVPGNYRIYVYHYLSEAEYVSAYFEVTVSNPSTTPETNPSEGTTASGDANNDGLINMADAVRIMQSIANPDKYELSEQGALNADIFNNGDGVTVKDAQFLQSRLLGLV